MQLAVDFSCKLNYLFLLDLKTSKTQAIPPRPSSNVGLEALTFDKGSRLQVPAACETQTVTFQTTVNLRPLRRMLLLSWLSGKLPLFVHQKQKHSFFSLDISGCNSANSKITQNNLIL